MAIDGFPQLEEVSEAWQASRRKYVCRVERMPYVLGLYLLFFTIHWEIQFCELSIILKCTGELS